MNVFIIPSWYPSEAFPSTGIFFREQAELIARYRPTWNVGISLWGSHEPELWIDKNKPLSSLIKLASKSPIQFYERLLHPNCVELFNPAFTWTRKIRKGNIRGIVEANELNLKRFILHYGKPQVIHAHVAYPGGYIAQKLSEKYGIPYMITEHMGPFPFKSLERNFEELIGRPMRKAGQVLAVSKHLTDRISSFGIHARHSTNFIDDSFFSPKETVRDGFTFLYVGRLVEGKGLHDLLEACQLLKKEKFHLKIIGSGPLETTLKKKAKRLGLPMISWQGEQSRYDVYQSLINCHALILPSHHENQPVSILEALACGRPVVATYCGGSEELISKENGVLAQVKNPIDLSSRMKLMMESTYNAQTIRNLFLEKHGAAGAIVHLEKHYRLLIENSKIQNQGSSLG